MGFILGQKLILIDIDGTLADADGFVPPLAASACREARKRGHIVYLSTGRTRRQIKESILAIGFNGAASAGGAHIETGDTAGNKPYQGDVIFNAYMPAELVKQIAIFLHSNNCGFSLEKIAGTQSNRRYLSHWEFVVKEMSLAGKTDDDLTLHIIELNKNLLSGEPAAISLYEGVSKMMYVGSSKISFADIKRNFGHACEIFHGSIPYFGEENGEIGPLGIHKGLALEKIAGYHGIPLSETIAFGDSDNDRKMLDAAGIGVAMGNATDALKAIASEVTSPMEEDGLYNGFKKLGLI
jgi:Cof subfamily protein (haloacid dehalogenase superfamily)